MMRPMLLLLRSPSIKGAILFAMSGGAFALGNLLMAAGLSQRDYGHFALLLGVMAITSNIAPLGLDQVLLRRPVRLGQSYLKPILISGGLIAVAAGIMTRSLYDLPWPEVLALMAGTVIYAVVRTIASALRRHGLPTSATLAETCTDWMILLGGIGVVAGLVHTGESVAGFIVVAGVVLMVVAARFLRPRELELKPTSSPRVLEAMPLLGIVAAGALSLQIERLLIPLLLSIDSLATFAVLAAVAVAPFRVLSAGIIASFAQQLRVAKGREEHRRLLAHELRLFGFVTVIASLGVTLVGPFAGDVLTAGRYHLDMPLCAAASFSGCARILQAIPRAVAIGIGSPADWTRLNVHLWFYVTSAAAGAALGAHWGLAALVAGAGAGSALATVPMWMSMRAMLIDRSETDDLFPKAISL
jgi:O-antigen/teichoic acid export membrane protein